MIKVAPSILAADFSRLAEEVAEAERAGADRIHVDVMDGHFVPNLTIGPVVVEGLRRSTRLPLETHLMVAHPDELLVPFAEAGSDSFLVHVEGALHLHRTIERIRALGKPAGVALNPATPVHAIEEVLPLVSLVLVMTVNPGFGGQQFIESVVPKIARVREAIERANPECELEVDGGIGPDTARQVVAAGADVLVAGTTIFRSSDGMAGAMEQLRRVAAEGLRMRLKRQSV